MTETLHPGGLRAYSTPDGDTVTLSSPHLEKGIEIEKMVLRAIAQTHAKDIVMAALDIRLHDLEEGDLYLVTTALEDLGIKFDVIGDPNR